MTEFWGTVPTGVSVPMSPLLLPFYGWPETWMASLLVHYLFYIALVMRKQQKSGPKAPVVGPLLLLTSQ